LNEQSPEQQLIALKKEHARLRQAYANLDEHAMALQVLQEMTLQLTSDLNLDTLLNNILNSAIKVVGAVAGSLFLLDERTDELVFSVVVGGGGETLEGQRMPRDRGIAGWVLNAREPLIVDDVSQDKRFYKGFQSSDFRTANILCVPLVTRGNAVGVIQVLNKISGEPFTQTDLELLTTFAAQSATAIETARLVQALRHEKERIVALEEDVRKRLARAFGCDPEEVALTRNASEGLEICQLGLDLSKGDEILTTNQDYPRMITTFKQRERREGVVLIMPEEFIIY